MADRQWVNRMRQRWHTVISPSCARVLGAVLDMRQRGERLRVRTIADRCGWTNLYWVQICLRKLRDHDLIGMEDFQGGTIRPTCRFISAEAL